MRYLKVGATTLLALLFLAPAAFAQETTQEGEDPVEDLPVLGNLEGGDQPDLPAQPDLPGQTADETGDTAPAPAATTTDTGGGQEILPVTGSSTGVLAASGTGFLVLGSALLLLVRRLRGAAPGAGGFLRDALWAA